MQAKMLGKVGEKAYYSAADVCGLVEEACRIALERLEKARSTKPIPLTRDMFEEAYKKILPTISQEMLKMYEGFR